MLAVFLPDYFLLLAFLIGFVYSALWTRIRLSLLILFWLTFSTSVFMMVVGLDSAISPVGRVFPLTIANACIFFSSAIAISSLRAWNVGDLGQRLGGFVVGIIFVLLHPFIWFYLICILTGYCP